MGDEGDEGEGEYIQNQLIESMAGLFSENQDYASCFRRQLLQLDTLTLPVCF